MAAKTVADKVRSGKKAALVGAAAATATVMAMGPSVPGVIPDATAALTIDAVTTGPLFRIADAPGFNSVELNTGVSALDPLTINLAYTNPDPVNLNDKVNAYPFGGFSILTIPPSFRRQPGGTLGTVILGASGLAAPDATAAYKALLSSASGTPVPG